MIHHLEQFREKERDGRRNLQEEKGVKGYKGKRKGDVRGSPVWKVHLATKLLTKVKSLDNESERGPVGVLDEGSKSILSDARDREIKISLTSYD